MEEDISMDNSMKLVVILISIMRYITQGITLFITIKCIDLNLKLMSRV